MSWRLEVTHHTGLRYSSPVAVSFNEARMTPADSAGQLLITHELSVSPGLEYLATQTTGERWLRHSRRSRAAHHA